MIEIKEIESGLIAQRLGIIPGDKLCSINRNVIRDEIDISFNESDDDLCVEVERKNKRMTFYIEKLPEEKLGITVSPFEFERCNNACIFCFYDQMPTGLRKSLYEKDDDFRLSFLYGNYITLTNMREDDFRRINEQRLSPLYISVHSTNPKVRSRLLNEGQATDLMGMLRKLSDAKIEIHTQIVLCSEINDGGELERTVFELSDLFPCVRSVAIVPVGLTKFREGLFPLKPISRDECLTVIKSTLSWQEIFREKFSIGFVYPADEIFMRGEFAMPMKEFYDGFPQRENGVGESRIFLDEIEEMDIEELKECKGSIVFVTAVLPLPWISLLRKRIEGATSIVCDVIPVTNSLFGETVTVSGLLVGKDILNSLALYGEHADIFIIPRNCLNENEIFLDDMSLSDLCESLGKRIIAAPSCMHEFPGLLKREFLL